ncbi:hypothetical protein Fleli_3764 [Bernardetia litoralis DSM 6794]|uniref:Uncharacterized protein n=1 Tax=Bernardetia litoralis (strain ATCC 23117 / DSM 6794 / NBRC 15988 / NCIMB 1366 / Fx l1 / Sio-4) TaxID=880071 RepID=I4AQ41_BERLS|nr:hypothetical protein [Bernardetia litoralis]AFM06076.1 hypothetical protein Fleli_3764 [Bernardetia litoralis DSM 6794]
MKNTYRILGATFLTILYSFVLGFVAILTIEYGVQSKKTTEQEEYFSSISTNYSLCYAPESINSVSSITTYSVTTFKKIICGFCVTSNATEQLLETEFSQYTSFVLNFLIQHRKKDIIFPSHYFW